MHAHVTVEDAAEIAGRILIGNKTKTTGLYYFVQNKTAVAQIGSKPQSKYLVDCITAESARLSLAGIRAAGSTLAWTQSKSCTILDPWPLS